MMPVVSLVLIVAVTNVVAVTTDNDLSGTTINLLTERNTLVHNPEYWTELFYNETGIRVNLIGMAQGDLHPEMMAAARDRVNYYDMFIYQGQRIPDYADCIVCDPGYRSLLEDLTDWVATEPDIVWSDIAYYLRSCNQPARPTNLRTHSLTRVLATSRGPVRWARLQYPAGR